MVFIVFGIIFFLNFFFLFTKSGPSKFYISVFSLSIFFILLLGVKETADSEGYMNFFENDEVKTDFLFRNLSTLFTNFGMEYYQLFQFHVILFGILYTFFISRFTNNIFLILIFYLLMLYVPLANQIRYYLAFGFFLNAIYLLYFSKKKYLAYLFIIISILSHSAITLFYGFIILNKFSQNNNYLKRCLIISLVFFALIFSLNSLGLNAFIGNYELYFSNDAMSSLLGGVFNALPNIIIIILLYIRAKIALKKHEVFKQDKSFQILYRLSFYSVIFMPASLYIQILSHRYIQASLIIWLCFYCYTLTLEKSFKVVFNHIICLTGVIIGLFYYTYFFSEIALGETSFYLKEFIRSFNSIEYLPNIEL
jgi:hypothetical protein